MNRKSLFSPETEVAVSSLVSIALGLFVGCVIILLVSFFDSSFSFKSALEGIQLILFGAFSEGRDETGRLVFGFDTANPGNLLFRATPVIMTGLSVAFAFKSGLFNIGAPGQYIIGASSSLIIALSLNTESLSPFLVWVLAFAGSLVAGALWGMIPGILKAYFSVNEVISGIMSNWIAAKLVAWIFEKSSLRNFSQPGKVGYIMPSSFNGVSTAKLGLDKLFPGSQVNGGIIVAMIIAVIVYVFLNKTTFGFEMKIFGSNRDTADYIGLDKKKLIIFSLAVAGALSGGAAALYYLSGNTEFFWSTYQSLPKEGFNGIPVALLASNNPLAVIFTGIFIAFLNFAGQELKNLTDFNVYIADIIIAVIVYLSAFSLVIRQYISKRKGGLR